MPKDETKVTELTEEGLRQVLREELHKFRNDKAEVVLAVHEKFAQRTS